MRKKSKGRTKRFEERNRRDAEVQTIETKQQVQRKPKKKTRLNGGRLAQTIFLVVLVVVLVMSVNNIFSLRAEQKALKDQNNALLLEKESLEDELKNVSDKEYIEEQARIQLKMIKPGEILYILEDSKDKDEKDEKDKKEDEKKN